MGCFPCFGSASQREEEEVKKKNEGKAGGAYHKDSSAATASNHGSIGKKVPTLMLKIGILCEHVDPMGSLCFFGGSILFI